MPDGRRDERRARNRAIHQKWWKPAQFIVPIEGRARVFLLHPDGTVYEKLIRQPITSLEEEKVREAKESGGPTPIFTEKGSRRVRDHKLVRAVQDHYADMMDRMVHDQEQTVLAMNRFLAKKAPAGKEVEAPDAA